MVTFSSALLYNTVSFRWQGCTVLCCESRRHGPPLLTISWCLQLWFTIRQYISPAQRRANVELWIPSLLQTSQQKHSMFWALWVQGRFVFSLTVPWPNYHVNPAQEGHFKTCKPSLPYFHIQGSSCGGTKWRQASGRARHCQALTALRASFGIWERGHASCSSGSWDTAPKECMWFLWEVKEKQPTLSLFLVWAGPALQDS